MKGLSKVCQTVGLWVTNVYGHPTKPDQGVFGAMNSREISQSSSTLHEINVLSKVGECFHLFIYHSVQANRNLVEILTFGRNLSHF